MPQQLSDYTPEQIRAAADHVRGQQAQEPQAAARKLSDYSPEQIRAAADFVRSQPESRQEPLGFFERAAASRAVDDPDRLEKSLGGLGFQTKRKGNEVLIAQGGKFVPWDPEGFDLGDFGDLAPLAAEVGVGIAAGTAKVAGALSTPVTGPAGLASASILSGGATGLMETEIQRFEQALGFRDELDIGEIGLKTAAGATIPGMGKLLDKGINFVVSKVAGKFAGKAAEPVARKAGEAVEATSGSADLALDPVARKAADSARAAATEAAEALAKARKAAQATKAPSLELDPVAKKAATAAKAATDKAVKAIDKAKKHGVKLQIDPAAQKAAAKVKDVSGKRSPLLPKGPSGKAQQAIEKAKELPAMEKVVVPRSEAFTSSPKQLITKSAQKPAAAPSQPAGSPTSSLRKDQPGDPFRVRAKKGTPKDITDAKLAKVMKGKEPSPTTGRGIKEKGLGRTQKTKGEETPDLTMEQAKALGKRFGLNLPKKTAEASEKGLLKTVEGARGRFIDQIKDPEKAQSLVQGMSANEAKALLGIGGKSKLKTIWNVIRLVRLSQGDVSALITPALIKKGAKMTAKEFKEFMEKKAA
jgi:hypothetical protein